LPVTRRRDADSKERVPDERRRRPARRDHPTHDLVVVRLGHHKGDRPGMQALNAALAELMRAVPAKANGGV
jgi:hypothetical protein